MKDENSDEIENTLLTFFIEHPFQIHSVRKIAEYCDLPESTIESYLISLEYKQYIIKDIIVISSNKIQYGYKTDLTNQKIYKILKHSLEQISKNNVVLYPYQECKTCVCYVISNTEMCKTCESKAPTEWIRYKPEGEQ